MSQICTAADCSMPVIVSVIVPAHNVELYIDHTLASIRAQTLRSLEILVVDDASCDATARMAAAHASQDPRVRLMRMTENRGVCRARNEGLAVALGRWIAFVDSDDWLEPGRLARMVEAAEHMDLDWLADDQFMVSRPNARPSGRVLRSEPAGLSRMDIAHLVVRDPPEIVGYGTLKPLVRRSFLRRHQLAFRLGQERYEDFLFHVDCGLHGARMGLLNQPLYYYRRRPGSLTTVDPLTTLTRMLEQNAIAEHAAREHGPVRLQAALARRADQIRSSLAYRRLLRDLGRREVGSALRTLRADPQLGITLMDRLAKAAGRRVRW